MKQRNEGQLTFWEASGIITGHGVGSGILSVPYLASRTGVFQTVLILCLSYAASLLLHLLIAELSSHNQGAQFVTCLKNDLFRGKKPFLTWFIFLMIGLSVLVNVVAFLEGAAAVFTSWLGLPHLFGMILFYFLSSLVVFAGLKSVGFFEKIAVALMTAIVCGLLIAVAGNGKSPAPVSPGDWKSCLALLSIVSFSLSAVMSTPLVVKGLDFNPKRIKRAIAAGLLVNTLLISLITWATLKGADVITKNGALVDLSESLGKGAGIAGYLFTLFALATSFWANTLNMRDLVSEQTGLSPEKSFLISSLPCLLAALPGISTFVGFTRFAGIVQVVTGLSVIVAFNRSRKRTKKAEITGFFGSLPFQIAVVLFMFLASLGAVLRV